MVREGKPFQRVSIGRVQGHTSMLSDSSFTVSCRVAELAAQLGPCLPLSPIYIQGLSTTTETYTTANQLQTLLRVNHPRKHPTSQFCQVQYTSSIIPLPISATPTASSKPPETDIPNKHNNTITAAQAQQHYRSSTTAQQHGSTAQYPARRISPVTQNTHTHAHSISDIDTRTTSHPVPPHPYHTPHNTNTHVSFYPRKCSGKVGKAQQGRPCLRLFRIPS